MCSRYSVDMAAWEGDSPLAGRQALPPWVPTPVFQSVTQKLT